MPSNPFRPLQEYMPIFILLFGAVSAEVGMELEIATMAIKNPARLLGIMPKTDEVQLADELFGVAQGVP